MSYDHTFTHPDDLSRFPKDTQRILTMAHELGWKTRWLGQSHDLACVMAPDGTGYSINVPRTNINHNRMKSWLNQITRHSDPDQVEDYLDRQTLVAGKTAGQRITMPSPTPPKRETAVARALREAEARAAAADKAIETYDETLSRGSGQDDLPPHGDGDPVYVVEVAQYRDGDTSVYLVSEAPWMVRRGGVDGSAGRMYESPAVLHRVWSDGGEDYRCRHCGWRHDNPRSVAAHASRSKGHPSNAQKDQQTLQVQHYEASEIKRPMSAIRRLTSELTHILDGMDDWSSMAPEALARTLAEAVYEARPDREPLAPLTPEQVIARITFLVDGGRLAEMHQQVEASAAALRAASERAEAAEREAERLREERKALAAMLADVAS